MEEVMRAAELAGAKVYRPDNYLKMLNPNHKPGTTQPFSNDLKSWKTDKFGKNTKTIIFTTF